MPNTPTIQLDLRNSASNESGWHNLEVNNHVYSYCYSGGDDGAGGLVQTVGQGRDTAPIQFASTTDTRYQINSCVFTNDGQQQLTWNGGNRAGSIVDANTQVENAEYCIIVTDTTTGCAIPCDPQVTNKPS
ncbi:hypothetical protein N800_07930 [Lysobacter daejeonensis GH1-9]|uniref:Uncharacterized protein n=1 Tax=Lysobacter daejeonensis GH1-9 TaxID=1385517 RepID=A0A0A0ESX0_9GAMM|nr:hypothetical protein [Lysobacter daejeonensis]KGM53310.1 hypothetical protein N800_07930 [Lysobacter daejeonensis GH1-9]